MNTIDPAVKNIDELLLWFMGYFAQTFRNRAIIMGGMVLRLLNSPRATNDLDILFVPFTSKKEILPELDRSLADIAGIAYRISVDSKCIRCLVQYGRLHIQIEGTIADSCDYESISTVKQGMPILLAVQRREVALAHKIAAWNERGLMRDLYDIYFFISVLDVVPDLQALQVRLKNVYSGRVNRSKSMSLDKLVEKLEFAHKQLSMASLEMELGAILSKEDLAGLDLKIKVAIYRLTAFLRPL